MYSGSYGRGNDRTRAQHNPLQIAGKSLPHSLEAERAVLGALLLNDENVPLVSEVLVDQDFYVPAHKLIYAAMMVICQQQRRIDLVTLQDELDKGGHLDTIGGIVYLIALQEDIPVVGLIAQHAVIVKEKAVLRELITCAGDIIANCYSQDDKRIEAVLDEAEKTIFRISEKRSRQSFVQLTIWLRKTFAHLTSIKEQGFGLTGIPTGFKKLDEMTSGFQNTDFIVLAARPSMGKTALALKLTQIAAANGKAVGFFSLEMSAEQLVLRLLSAESGVAHHNIRNATITSDEWIDLTNVAASLAEYKLYIDDTAMQSISDIRTKARKLKRDYQVQMLVIDYLQLIHSSRFHENRHQEVSEISRSLKALAKELEIPIVALSQLSRAVESRVDKRPMLSDLRESGAIEQDADLIMFLYRDIVYNPETEDPALAEIIIGKQRNGPTGTVNVHYQRELTSFVDYDE